MPAISIMKSQLQESGVSWAHGSRRALLPTAMATPVRVWEPDLGPRFLTRSFGPCGVSVASAQRYPAQGLLPRDGGLCRVGQCCDRQRLAAEVNLPLIKFWGQLGKERLAVHCSKPGCDHCPREQNLEGLTGPGQCGSGGWSAAPSPKGGRWDPGPGAYHQTLLSGIDASFSPFLSL